MLYSHSRLSTFEQCPYKYKLKYIEKIEASIPETIETFLGSRVHETLEKLYKDLEYHKNNTVEELLQYYRSQWHKQWSDDIVIVKSQYTMDNYMQMGEKYIRDYFARYFPFNHDKTIAIEDRIIIDLDDDGKYKLQGYIDRLAERGDGRYEIHDYKTNARLPSLNHIKHDRQLALYMLGVKKQYPRVKDVNLVWHFLKFDKEISSAKSEEELQELKEKTIALIQKIEAATSFPTKPSVLCNWCEYKPMCPQWSHLFVLNEKPENEYMSDSGLKLVDRYAVLKQKTNQMKLDLYAEIEKIEEALIAYAEKKHVEVVFGSKNQVHIKKQKRYVIPSKGSDEREQLKKKLIKWGKWDQIAQLDSYALNKILLEQKWDADLLEILKKYIRFSEKRRLFLSKKRED